METPKILTLEELIAPINVRTLEIPELGGAVKIGPLSKAAQMQIGQSRDAEGKLDQEAWEKLLLRHCLLEPKLTEEGLDALWHQSAAVVDKILSEVYYLGGFIGKETYERAQASFLPRTPES